jgi:hypothetical protein
MRHRHDGIILRTADYHPNLFGDVCFLARLEVFIGKPLCLFIFVREAFRKRPGVV